MYPQFRSTTLEDMPPLENSMGKRLCHGILSDHLVCVLHFPIATQPRPNKSFYFHSHVEARSRVAIVLKGHQLVWPRGDWYLFPGVV